MKLVRAALPVALLVLGTAGAQAGDNPVNRTNAFIEQAALGGMFEIETSRVALDKSSNPAVREFSQTMIDEHTEVDKELRAAVAAANVQSPPLPTVLDKAHSDMVIELKKETAEDFDEAYVDDLVDAHEKAIVLFEDYAKDGDNPVLKKFAADTLPVLKQHKEHVDKLDNKVD